MKKILSLVLICAMGFGMISCVESEESQSVRDVRDAKAEQLKALADLYTAQAQAQIIKAEADAAYRAAETAFKQAEAELKGIELQKAKETYAQQLEVLMTQYEADLLKQKAAVALQEKTLMTNLDNLEDAINARIQTLYTKYQSALSQLGEANKNLLDAKINIAQLEADIIDIEEAAKKDIEDQKEIIAEQEEVIEKAEAELAILTDNAYNAMDKDSLYVEYLKALVAYKDADLNYQQNEAKAAADARKEAWTAISKIGTDKADYVNESGILSGVIESETDQNNMWPNSETGEGTSNAVLSYYVSESVLGSFKSSTLATDFAQAVKDAETALETAKAAEAGFKGFENAFEDAEAARKTIEKFNELKNTYYYGEANPSDWTVDNTVKFWEDNLVTVKKDTSDVDGQGPYAMLNKAKADLDVLTNDKNEGYATNAVVKAYADAQAALKALPATATADEKAAAEEVVADAKAKLDKAIYDAQVGIETAQAKVNEYTGKVTEAEAKVVAAKEMEGELLKANTEAVAAVEVLNKLFDEEDGEFFKFWNAEAEDENGNPIYPNQVIVGTHTNHYASVYVLANRNPSADDDVDIVLDDNGKVKDGTYYHENLGYSIFYFYQEYKDVLAMYTSNVASKTDALTAANNNLANMGEWQSDWDAKEAELRAFVKSLNDQIAAAQTLVDAYNKTVETAQKAKDAVEDLRIKSEALDGLVSVADGDQTLNGLINAITKEERGGVIYDAEEKIKKAEEEIVKAEKILDGWKDKNSYSGESSEAIAWKEHKIEEYKAQIEELEAKIEYLTIQVENAKTALDAAISAANAE